jgi:hypothetical protein
LRRAGHRHGGEQVSDETGPLAAAPSDELTDRLEWFVARFGGLRYDVRRRVRVGDWAHESVRRWEFDVLGDVWEDHTGWSFGWSGERVSSPVFYRVHADGRFGVSAGGSFLEASPSVHHMIEGHALMDDLFEWEPVPPVSLETWVPVDGGDGPLRRLLDSLPAVPEASGPCDRWARSDEFAVRLFLGWTAANPRTTGVMMWSRDGRVAGIS